MQIQRANCKINNNQHTKVYNHPSFGTAYKFELVEDLIEKSKLVKTLPPLMTKNSLPPPLSPDEEHKILLEIFNELKDGKFLINGDPYTNVKSLVNMFNGKKLLVERESTKLGTATVQTLPNITYMSKDGKSGVVITNDYSINKIIKDNTVLVKILDDTYHMVVRGTFDAMHKLWGEAATSLTEFFAMSK